MTYSCHSADKRAQFSMRDFGTLPSVGNEANKETRHRASSMSRTASMNVGYLTNSLIADYVQVTTIPLRTVLSQCDPRYKLAYYLPSFSHYSIHHDPTPSQAFLRMPCVRATFLVLAHVPSKRYPSHNRKMSELMTLCLLFSYVEVHEGICLGKS